jgi:hypothetical protein
MSDITTLMMAAAGQGGAETDPDFNDTVLLLHGDGTNGAQNNTFLDSSTNNFTITRNGNTTQGTFSPFSLAAGEFSNFFDGSSALSFEPNSITIGSGTDFCIEAWVYPTNLSAVDGGIFQAGTQNGSLAFRHNTDGTLRVLASAVSFQLDTTTALTNNEWYHIAATRSSGTLRIFINGVEDASTANSTDYTDPSSSNDFVVGGRFFSSAYQDEFYGYISNLRFVVGSAVYTSGFTPSTTPLTDIANTELLTCQSNRFADNSSNALVGVVGTGTPSVQPFSPFAPSAAYSASVNGGSGYFDGTNDNLTAPANAAWACAGDYAIEAWVYIPSLATDMHVLGTGGPGATDQFVVESDGQFYWFNLGTPIGTVKAGMWNHLLATRSGSAARGFVNGVLQVYNASTTGTVGQNLTMYIGERSNASNDFSGYISNIRYINGSIPTAYQTSETTVGTSVFSPPTAPFTATSQGATSGDVKLLTNFTNAGIFDNTGKNNLETVGNAQIDTTTKKYGTGSMEFDGTGDWLLMPSSQNFAFGTGPYTVEFWLYKNSSGAGERGIFQTQTASLFGLSIFADGSTLYIDERKNAFDGSDPRISGTITQNDWIHVAVCREGGTGGSLKAFVNGTQLGSTVTSNLRNLASTGPTFIGNNSVAANAFIGYIDDLRITKGVARYTTTFTPPTAALPDL